MKRNHRALLTATFAALSLGSASAAKAEDWKMVGEFGWFGVGKALEVEKDHYYWVGEFSGTFFNDKGPGSLFHRASVRCPAWNDLNLATGKGKAGGYCVLKDKEAIKPPQLGETWAITGARLGLLLLPAARVSTRESQARIRSSALPK